MIFYPTKNQYYSPESLGVEHEEVFFKTRDGLRLHGWWLNSDGPKKANIIFVHGNAQNITAHIASVAWLTKKGFDVFLFDYRGYGLSQGSTNIDGVISDTMDAIEYGSARSLKENKPVFVLGQSLGASLSIYAVANSPVKKTLKSLIVVDAFADYHQITQETLSKSWFSWLFQWPLSLMINNDYSPLEVVAKISPTPIVILHSPDDEVISYRHGKSLYKKAKKPKSFVKVVGKHNDILLLQRNRDKLMQYLDSVI